MTPRSFLLAQDLTDLLADAVKSMREAGDVEEAEEMSDPRWHVDGWNPTSTSWGW